MCRGTTEYLVLLHSLLDQSHHQLLPGFPYDSYSTASHVSTAREALRDILDTRGGLLASSASPYSCLYTAWGPRDAAYSSSKQSSHTAAASATYVVAQPRQLDPKTQTSGGPLCKARSRAVLAGLGCSPQTTSDAPVNRYRSPETKQRQVDPF